MEWNRKWFTSSSKSIFSADYSWGMVRQFELWRMKKPSRDDESCKEVVKKLRILTIVRAIYIIEVIRYVDWYMLKRSTWITITQDILNERKSSHLSGKMFRICVPKNTRIFSQFWRIIYSTNQSPYLKNFEMQEYPLRFNVICLPQLVISHISFEMEWISPCP